MSAGARLRQPRLLVRALAVGLMLLVLGNGAARGQLDQMQRMIENDHKTAPAPAASSRGIPLSVPPYIRRAWAAIATRGGEINTALREEFSLLDHVETDLGKVWDSVASTVSEAVEKWPFPHFYWAPGVVEDATEAVGEEAYKVVAEPLPDPSTAPAQEALPDAPAVPDDQ